jgi:PKD repeat protein
MLWESSLANRAVSLNWAGGWADSLPCLLRDMRRAWVGLPIGLSASIGLAGGLTAFRVGRALANSMNMAKLPQGFYESIGIKMKKFAIVWLMLLLLGPLGLFAQYPALEFSVQNVTSPATGTVDVSVLAGTNWQNITSFRGTFVFNPAVITWNSLNFWGLSYPAGATFSSPSAGVVTFSWNSLITVGPTLPNGGTVFTMRFNVVGAPGDVSPITFAGSPQAMFWNNGFGWSGNNFSQMDGSVTLICATPVASFTAAPNFYNYGFTSTGSGATQSFWDFGDGSTDTVANPNHTYASSGTYTVCLITTNICGADTACQTFNVCPLPFTNYTYTINQLAVTFAATSTNGPIIWHWDFGDGNTSTLQNPTHTYAAPGIYATCLIASNGCGADTACYSFTVGCPAPATAWSDSTDGLMGFFTDISANQPTAWLWDFGDGTFSSLPNPFHTYTMPGTYTVCLIASSVCGADTSCMPVTVTCAAPQASFSDVVNGAMVQFTDLSTNAPDTWAWDFGDGNTDTLQHPSHTYAVDGNYTVCLIASSICGADTVCSTLTINTVGIQHDWHADLQVFPNPATDMVQIVYRGALHLRVHGLHGELLGLYSGADAIVLDLHALARGVYFVEVATDDGVAVRKLILR